MPKEIFKIAIAKHDYVEVAIAIYSKTSCGNIVNSQIKIFVLIKN